MAASKPLKRLGLRLDLQRNPTLQPPKFYCCPYLEFRYSDLIAQLKAAGAFALAKFITRDLYLALLPRLAFFMSRSGSNLYCAPMSPIGEVNKGVRA